ncbi:MAG: M48 family metallopeptidase [Alphaproteobacteria bacterium]|nr:M48 family metallopeptidase [Alphaproteobacteria bacterium]
MIEGERPIRARRAAPAARAVALLTAVSLLASPTAASAQGGIPLIRDAEIEQLLREYTQPILRAAGLAKQNIQIVLINDRSFNAFVMDGRRIFMNAGLLMDAKTPNEVIGVLAHETGHIAGGHLSRLRQQLAMAQTQSIIAVLLGAGAMIAASRGGVGGNPAAAIMGPQESIRRSLLSYIRSQEEQADRAAVKFLNDTGQSPKGMYETFKRLADQVLFVAHNADPYLSTHPLPAERVSSLGALARTSPHWDKKDSPELQLRHDMMRAKLIGFLDRGDTVARRYPFSDNSLPARYARAIATYRHGALRGAVGQIDALIQAQPGNPYFHELKGQALLEGGKPAEAIAPLRRAAQLAPSPALIQVMLGQALNATNDPKLAGEAVKLLRSALMREPEASQGYAQLAMAYSRTGNLAEADLAAAQAAFFRGDHKTARDIASRAKTRFPVGSPGWVKADDLATYKPPNLGSGPR